MDRRIFLERSMYLGFSLSLCGFGKARAGTGTTPANAAGVETARFGPSNGAGTGAYDTGGAASDGTYGAFTVSGGVITPNTAPAPGSYTVGGYPVLVDPKFHAVANQSEANALTAAHYGKTIVIRRGARITWNHGGSGTAQSWGRRTSMKGTVITGDGGDPRADLSAAADADAHFDHIKFRSCADVTLAGLRITPTNPATAGACLEFLEASGGGQLQENVSVVGCVLKTSNPGAFADYSTGGFPGRHGILCQANIPVQGVEIRDNVFYGNHRAIEIPAANRWLEIVGNWIDMNYEDFIKINKQYGDCPTIIAGNYATRPLGKPTDAGNPHTDILQFQGGGGSNDNIVLEANGCFPGNARAAHDIQVWYVAGNSGSGFSVLMRGNYNVDASIRSFNVASPNGCRTEWCATIPNSTLTLPYGGAQAGHRYDGTVRGQNEISYSFFGDYLTGAKTTVFNSTKCKTFSAAALRAALPAYPIDETGPVPEMSAFLAMFTPTPGGALDGQGPTAVVTLPAGAERSQYQLDPVAVQAPVLWAATVTPARTEFSATVQTSVDLNPIFWAVVPAGTPVATGDDIKKRRIGGALDYGYSKVGIKQIGVPILISGTAGALAPGTAYELVAFQENGWTLDSAVVRAAFTTNP